VRYEETDFTFDFTFELFDLTFVVVDVLAGGGEGVCFF
jgi:hypothetical protein